MGIALINRNLTLLDANATLSALLLPPSHRGAQGSGVGEAQGLAKGCSNEEPQTPPKGHSPEVAIFPRPREEVVLGKRGHAGEEGGATDVVDSSQQRAVVGCSLREFVSKIDARRLANALSHITEVSACVCVCVLNPEPQTPNPKPRTLKRRCGQVSFTDEELRACVLGLRLRVRREADADEGVETGGREGVGVGAGAGEGEMRPVEVVPCGGRLYGEVFVLYVYAVATEASPEQVPKPETRNPKPETLSLNPNPYPKRRRSRYSRRWSCWAAAAPET